MKDQDLRKTIGSRIKQRRTELNLHQKYIAEVTHSINAYNDIADVIRLYTKRPEKAAERLANLIADFSSDEE